MQIGLVAGGWIFFPAAGTCGSSPPSASAANTRPSAPMLMFHSALIAAHNGRLCKSAASPCAASYLFSRHFLSSDMPRGVGGRREFEIYEVLPLSRQRNVFPLAQIAMRNADWLRLFYIWDIYSPRLWKGNCESTRLKAMNVRCRHHLRTRFFANVKSVLIGDCVCKISSFENWSSPWKSYFSRWWFTTTLCWS